MTRYLLLLPGLFLSLTVVQGQKLQIGLSAGINGTIFHKGQSVYDNYFFETKTKAGIGLSVPCYVKLFDYWMLRTGIGFQNKKYHFEQNKFDFPDVTDGTGTFYFRVKFTATEVPLIICLSPAGNDSKYKIEYKLGCILTHNTPKAMTIGVESFQYSGTDTVFYDINPSQNWAGYFSPDIFAGISLIKTKQTLRRHELTISYQYGFAMTTKYEFTSTIRTTTMKKEYYAILSPTLSYVALAYTFYPKWLNVIRDKGEQPK